MNKRNTGIDLFRIFCCIGVLNYHTVDDVLGSPGAGFIYFASSFCIPGFFLMSGYLLGSKSELSPEYIETKVKTTLTKLIGWVIFWVAVRFIRTGELIDLWGNITSGAVQAGILPVTWFLFTYCMLLIISYPLKALLNKNKYICWSIAAIWGVLLALGMGQDWAASRTQTLWLHLYAGYFFIGMSLSSVIDGILDKIEKWIVAGGAGLMFAVSSCVYAWKIQITEVFRLPASYYGEWYYTVWFLSLFVICLFFSVKNEKISYALKVLADNTFVVYLGHLPILLYVTALYPLQSTQMAVFLSILLFVVLEILAQTFKKMPILRKLV